MNNSGTSDMSNNLDNILKSVGLHVMIWGGIFILIAGNVGCIGSILVFRSQKYRKQACFIYLFWENIASLCILDCILLTRILESGFQISLMDASDVFCRIREFISLFMYQNENTLFLFATLDRILSAQRSNKLRQWSNRVSLAYKIIILNALVWIVITSHRLIFYTNTGESCRAQEGIYRTFDTYLDVSLSAVGSPLVVIILAGLLWHSVRSVTKRRAAMQGQDHNQQIDLQLTIMLFLQSVLAIINYVPFGVFILYRMFTDYWIKSPLLIAWEQLIVAFIRLSSYLFAAGGFYVSIISNKSFRKQFLGLLGIQTSVVNPATATNTGRQLTTRTNNQ
ncbi:hypothetical protein I4U23_031370 [Adineta vaga]|nr:hypothetical protein I4U23_031370 [Adineta vaga]